MRTCSRSPRPACGAGGQGGGVRYAGGAGVALALALLLSSPHSAHAAAALATIASQAAKAVGTAPALVVTAPLTSDVQAPRGEELSERVAQLIAGAANAAGGATKAHPQSATLGQARVLAGKGGTRLVFVQPAIANGVLRVTLDAYPAASNGWDRVRNPEPPPSAHAFAEAPIDAEVRAFLVSIPLEHASVHRAKHDEGDVLAAACGDLDGDGGMELVLVSRTRVAAGHVNAGHFTPSRTAPWSALAPRAPVPMREPLAGVSFRFDGDRTLLLAGITDRGGVELDRSLTLVGSLHGFPVSSDACGTPSFVDGAFKGDPFVCADPGVSAVIPVAPGLAPLFDAFAAGDVIGRDGVAKSAAMARAPGGKLVARLESLSPGADPATTTLDGVGAQVALGDLDQDGAPEIITSVAEGEDAIDVVSWDGATPPRPRLHLPAPGGVRALCVCPPEQGGTPALVAVVANEVWIVR
jgi:hypothetical protein